jgi:hypothetical protein
MLSTISQMTSMVQRMEVCDSAGVFGIPPDGAPSRGLLFKIKSAKEQGRPLLHVARMSRLPYGFILL